jgi:hypothetical protein
MSAFSTDQLSLVEKALDYAWELYLKSRRLTTENLDLAKGAVAYAVLDAARSEGDRNPRQLAKAAVTRVVEHERRLRLQR